MAVDVKQLRIGNWLHSNITDVDYQCEISDFVHITNGYDEGDTFYIPLTEEWLTKFGFELRNNVINANFHNYWLPNNYAVAFCIKEYKPDHSLGAYCGKTDVKLNFVHQLQNLYFAHTGYELTIK
jgi:hypothetical protein